VSYLLAMFNKGVGKFQFHELQFTHHCYVRTGALLKTLRILTVLAICIAT
jgi:hypothetical protein